MLLGIWDPRKRLEVRVVQERRHYLAAAAEARTQTPIKGVDAATLDKIEKAQRAVGHAEWWCVNFGILQSSASAEGSCVVLVFFGWFFRIIIFLWHVNWCTSCILSGE